MRGGPGEKLREAVDLIVMTAMRECQNLELEVAKPRGRLGEQHVARLDYSALRLEAHDLGLLLQIGSAVSQCPTQEWETIRSAGGRKRE